MKSVYLYRKSGNFQHLLNKMLRKSSIHIEISGKNGDAAHTEDEIRETFEKAEKSLFLKGKKNSDETKFKDWKADFNWLVQEEHFVNTINGRYDNSEEDERNLEKYK